MKNNQIILKKEDVADKKSQRIQKAISSLYWIGWSGGYKNPKKK